MRRLLAVLIFGLSAAASAQVPPAPRVPKEPAPSRTLDALKNAADLSGAAVTAGPTAGKSLGELTFDGAALKGEVVAAGSQEEPLQDPVVTVKPKDFGQDDPDDGEDSELGRIIRRVLRDPKVREALDEARKEQSEKFAKEVVDNVTKDPRVQKLIDGPSKTKSILVNSGIAGAGALLGGIGLALGVSALGYVGLGIMAAGLIGLLIAWLV